MLKFILTFFTAILLGFLAGYFLRDSVLAEITNLGGAYNSRDGQKARQGARTLSVDPAILDHAANLSAEDKSTQLKTWTFEDIADQHTVFDQLIVAYRVAAQSNSDQLEALIKLCLKSNDPFYNPHLIAIFFEKYTALDPIAALAFVAEEPRLNEQYLVGHILTSWVRADPEAAVEYFIGLNNQLLVRAIGPRLLTDPIVTNAGLNDEVASKIGPESDVLVDRIIARTTPPAELFESALLQTGSRRTRQLQNALSSWASRDPEAALARINQLTNASERKRFTQTAIMLYSQVDPESALAYVRNSLADDPRIEGMVITAMAAADPENNIALVEAFARRTGNSSPIMNLLSNWVSKDPAKAFAYASTLDKDIQVKAYGNIAYSYVQSYPSQGVDWLLTLGNEHRQTKVNVLRSLSRVDSQLAEDTVRRVDDGALRASLINSLASYKSESNPSLALAWVEQFKEEDAYRQAKTSILRTWANVDPESAVNEISDDLDNKELAPILSQAATSWYRRSPDDAVDWVESLPAGSGRERAIASIVSLMAAKDPSSAINLANQITNQQSRRDANRSIAYSWYAREPDQLEYIISSLKLTEQDAAQLRQARRGQF
ncbi:MAG: hypothetical protein ACJAVI_003583 [Candidatus Azotimanducaceae bacterium]|jgi:hypothetical protein